MQKITTYFMMKMIIEIFLMNLKEHGERVLKLLPE